MNQKNYASQEASKRLVDAGIVLETEAVWAFVSYCNRPSQDDAHYALIIKPIIPWKEQCPAPSMAEVWRELPESIRLEPTTIFPVWKHLTIEKAEARTEVYYRPCTYTEIVSSANPTDALIDLLIWVRKEQK